MSQVEEIRTDSTDTEENELARGLGPLEVTTIIVGGAIGSGIFQAPSSIASSVGSPGMTWVVWASQNRMRLS